MGEFIFFTNEDWEQTDQPVQIKKTDVPFSSNPHEWVLGKIEECDSLKADWDGYGATPVLPEIVEIAKNFVRMSDGDILEKVSDVFPNSHGTLTFEWKRNDEEKMSLEIGKSNYSYFLRYNSKDPKFVDGYDVLSDAKKITQEVSEFFSK